MTIRVIGRADYSRYVAHPFFVDVTAQSASSWQKGLAPEVLGPVKLYGGRKAQTMAGAWEFCKVYANHTDDSGGPSPQYWDWATEGWNKFPIDDISASIAERSEYVYWDGKRLGPLDARQKVYWPLYRNAVAATPSFAHLKTMVDTAPEVVLFDFNGYDEEAKGLTLKEVLLDLRRPLSHAFILKAMLLHGEHVTPTDVLSNNAQMGLF